MRFKLEGHTFLNENFGESIPTQTIDEIHVGFPQPQSKGLENLRNPETLRALHSELSRARSLQDTNAITARHAGPENGREHPESRAARAAAAEGRREDATSSTWRARSVPSSRHAERLKWTDPETGTDYGFRQVGETETVARSDIPFPGFRVGEADSVSRVDLEKVELSARWRQRRRWRRWWRRRWRRRRAYGRRVGDQARGTNRSRQASSRSWRPQPLPPTRALSGACGMLAPACSARCSTEASRSGRRRGADREDRNPGTMQTPVFTRRRPEWASGRSSVTAYVRAARRTGVRWAKSAGDAAGARAGAVRRAREHARHVLRYRAERDRILRRPGAAESSAVRPQRAITDGTSRENPPTGGLPGRTPSQALGNRTTQPRMWLAETRPIMERGNSTDGSQRSPLNDRDGGASVRRRRSGRARAAGRGAVGRRARAERLDELGGLDRRPAGGRARLRLHHAARRGRAAVRGPDRPRLERRRPRLVRRPDAARRIRVHQSDLGGVRPLRPVDGDRARARAHARLPDGYDGYDQHVVAGRTAAELRVLHRLGEPHAPTAATSPACPRISCPTALGLGERKLPSALEAAIVRAAQGSAGASSQVPIRRRSARRGRGSRQRRLRRRGSGCGRASAGRRTAAPRSRTGTAC